MRLTPDAETFRRLCRPGRAVPVATEIDADLDTPVSLLLKASRDGGPAFLFESVEGGERSTRWSFAGSRPRGVLRWSLGDGPDPLEAVRAHLRTHEPVDVPGLPPFTGGLVGWLGYDAVRLIEPRVPASGPDELGFPDALFMDFDTVIAIDHVRHTAQLVHEVRCDAGDDVDRLYAEAAARLAALRDELLEPLPARPVRSGGGAVALRATRPPEEFEEAVRQAREAIAAGECQQIVLSQRFDAEIDIDPLDIYRALRRINPSPYLFFVRSDGHALVGSSPEALVRLRDGELTLRPIAGTRPRGHDAEEDARLERELLADPKENAEHIMLVDLARNDAGRVCEIGSVRVEALRQVERYSHVLHLVSEVRGRLAAGLDAVDALRATFPAGTVSGAPKVRAMEIIDELETARRGPYAGCTGYFSRNGNMDMAITIRTLLHSPGRVSVQAGAGIVYDSDPAAEQRETVAKASALFAAVAEAQR